jgi:V8-like Glu-specific endopeptidase
MLTSPLYELAIKRRGAKIAKKPVGDTTVYPYSCIGLLVASFDGVLRCGTGSLISKNLILTAASNILDKETQRIATSVKFVLNLKGQQGDIF